MADRNNVEKTCKRDYIVSSGGQACQVLGMPFSLLAILVVIGYLHIFCAFMTYLTSLFLNFIFENFMYV